MFDRLPSPSSRGLLLALFVFSCLAGCDEDCPQPSVCDVGERACQREIMRAVSCMRGGDTELPPVTLMTESELAEFMGAGAAPTPEQLEGYELWTRGLSLFQLAPSEYTRESARGDWVSQVAAAYFPGTKEIVVVDRGESLASEEAVSIFAHEVVHALQDADYGLTELGNKWGTSYDASLALDAIIEGEAVLYQNLFGLKVRDISPGDIDWQRYFGEWRAESLTEGELDEAPVAMADIRFPYAFGGGLVTQYYLEGNRAAVDALIAQPPRSTREVMFGRSDTEPDVQGFWNHASPNLGTSFEARFVVSLGAWITRMHAAHMGVPLTNRLDAPEELSLDAFAVHVDEATGQLVSSWRARMEDASATIFPGLDATRFAGFTDGALDAFFLAGDPALSDAHRIAWGAFPEAEEADDEMAEASSLWRRANGVRGCDARVPSFMSYRRQP